MLAGGALACTFGRLRHGEAASNVRGAAGAALIALAAAVLDCNRAFPGWWAVLPVAATVLLLSAPAAFGCRHLLSSRTMISLGKISYRYPLYLWHWVLLVFFAIVKFKDLTALERPLVVGLSIALAAATYHFVEIPFRFGRPIPLKMASLGTADGRGRAFSFSCRRGRQ